MAHSSQVVLDIHSILAKVTKTSSGSATTVKPVYTASRVVLLSSGDTSAVRCPRRMALSIWVLSRPPADMIAQVRLVLEKQALDPPSLDSVSLPCS